MLPEAPWNWDRLESKIRAVLPEFAGVIAAKPLHGGMIHSVFELDLAGEPGRAVIKVSPSPGDPFGREFRELRHLWSNRLLPCPEPWATAPTDGDGPAFLLMERLPGTHWGAVSLDAGGQRQVEEHLARLLLHLHRETSTGFCRFGEPPKESWLQIFLPMLETNLRLAEPRLPADWVRTAARRIGEIAKAWDRGGPAQPVLVHGDVWSGNVLVSRSPAGWMVSGLVDPALHFADEEYELAYLECFQTVGEPFFRAYRNVAPERDGYEVRRLYYWLNTLLLHVHVFGDAAYVRQTGRILDALRKA